MRKVRGKNSARSAINIVIVCFCIQNIDTRTYIEEEKGTIALEEEEDDDDERQAINFGRSSNRIFKDIFINRTIQT
jgi:hypothetical protein